MPERIQRRRIKGWRLPSNTVIVTRQSKWGNPFVVGTDWMYWAALRCGYRADRTGQRVAAVALYKAWITNTKVTIGPIWKDANALDQIAVGIARFGMTIAKAQPTIPAIPALTELRGKDLCCWCPLVAANGNPVPCHADILLELANA